MGSYLYLTLCRSLLVTVAAELLWAFLLRIRGRGLVVVGIANILTNPVYVYTVLQLRVRTAPDTVRGLQVLLEGGIVLLEGLFYARFLKEVRHPFLLSLTANLFSIVTGTAIMYVVYRA
ncbi:MAG: hypothetical protein IIY55_10115 [Blautia sp.]|nr:hypothetical protein [Blautia sp.]